MASAMRRFTIKNLEELPVVADPRRWNPPLPRFAWAAAKSSPTTTTSSTPCAANALDDGYDSSDSGMRAATFSSLGSNSQGQ